MGLLKSCLDVITPYLPNAHVLLLGYQDLVLAPSEIAALGLSGLQQHPTTGHVETRAAFTRKLGAASLMIIDRAEIRGGERVVDLNYPQRLGPFDLVVDSGTIEHCFNPGQALLNAAGAVRVGGRIFHTPPLTMLNHGFYNLCPTLLHDFYTQNGWDIELLTGVERKGRGGRFTVPPVDRFDAPSESVMHCLARRVNDAALKIPVQSKYA